MMDTDGSGLISIDDIVKFAGAEPASERKMQSHAGNSAWGSAEFIQPEEARPATAPVPPSHRPKTTPRPKRPARPLDSDVLEKIRSKIKAASYTGSGGKQLDILLARFDSDNSGQLDPDEVRRAMRRTLRITEESISDAEILSWCAMLDTNSSGTVCIQEIMHFVGLESEISKRTGKALKNSQTESSSSFEMRPTTAASQGSTASRSQNQGLQMELNAEALQRIRSKMKAAAYTGTGGPNLQETFDRLDSDHSGFLETQEVRAAVRRNLRIPDTLISDAEISTLCGMLDVDKSGSVSIDELVAFIG